MLLDFILVCSVQFSTFLNVPELWRACLFNHNCLFFETRLWNSNLNGLNFAEFSHVFHHVSRSHMIQSPISGSSRTNKIRWSSVVAHFTPTLMKQYWNGFYWHLWFLTRNQLWKLNHCLEWIQSVSFETQIAWLILLSFCSISMFFLSQKPNVDDSVVIVLFSYDLVLSSYDLNGNPFINPEISGALYALRIQH